MKAYFATLVLILGVAAVSSNANALVAGEGPAGEDQGVSSTTVDYSTWTVVRQQRLVVPVVDPGSVPLRAEVGVGSMYVENPNDPNSLYVTDFKIFGDVILRTVPGDPKTFEMAVGKTALGSKIWAKGRQGAMPKTYLEMEYHLFRVSEIVGVKLVLEQEDGKPPLEVVVKPENLKK